MDEKTRARMKALAESKVANQGLLPVTEPTEQKPGQAPPGRWRGLGDVVASATQAVGITPCVPCKKRQERLNKLVPFKKP